MKWRVTSPHPTVGHEIYRSGGEIVLLTCHLKMTEASGNQGNIVRAIDAALESIAKAIAAYLLTLATGTGKTSIAFHISWKLFQSKWNLSGEPTRRPDFVPCRQEHSRRSSIQHIFCLPKRLCRPHRSRDHKKTRSVPKNANVFFTIFQTFTTGETDFAYEQYRRDFFDFIIIDECHRGGANDESQWRAILEHFEPAVQLGLTATPKRKHNADTYAYFGEPVYTYSQRRYRGWLPHAIQGTSNGQHN